MRLRLLMTADTAGGVWVYAVSLCAALARHDVDVRLVALGEPSPRQRAAAQELPNVELVVRPTRLEWMAEPWRDLDGLAVELLEMADRADCDLVHLNHLVHGHLDWGRPVVCAVHSCVQSWFDAVRGQPAPAEWDHYRDRVGRSLRAADHVFAPSRWMLAQAQRFYGPFRGASVIANGSAAPLGEPDASRRGVLAAGRVWDEAKNLSALADVREGFSQPLDIAGPCRAPDPGAAAQPEARGDVPQEVLWGRMRRACVFAAPARYEPFGLGILEAARSGCALVLGDIPSLRETWDGAARFVDPLRSDAWQTSIEHLLQHPDERIRLAEAARRRAAHFTLDRMAVSHLDLYRRVGGTGAREAS